MDLTAVMRPQPSDPESEPVMPAVTLTLGDFEGPLDLLLHLIEKNKIDIWDIPITGITDQYLTYLDGLDQLDMDLASDFLLMAATLLQMKSRLLLPRREQTAAEDTDPREELVLKLLEYRRCKMLAQTLVQRQERFAGCRVKLPETAERLGLPLEVEQQRLVWDSFEQACRQIAMRNRNRFQDLSAKISRMLTREKRSLRDIIRQVWQRVRRQSRVFFNEIFPVDQTSRAERVTGFLAVLELLRLDQITALQERPFDVILLERHEAQAQEFEQIAGLEFAEETET